MSALLVSVSRLPVSCLALMAYALINASKAVCLWLTSCCRIAMDKAFRVPTKTAKVFALVNPV